MVWIISWVDSIHSLKLFEFPTLRALGHSHTLKSQLGSGWALELGSRDPGVGRNRPAPRLRTPHPHSGSGPLTDDSQRGTDTGKSLVCSCRCHRGTRSQPHTHPRLQGTEEYQGTRLHGLRLLLLFSHCCPFVWSAKLRPRGLPPCSHIKTMHG